MLDQIEARRDGTLSRGILSIVHWYEHEAST